MGRYAPVIAKIGIPLVHKVLWTIFAHGKNKDKIPLAKRYAQINDICQLVSRGLNIEYEVKGLENLPSDTVYCLTPNHMSAYDPLTLLSIIDQPLAFVGKKELESNFIMRRAFNYLDSLFMDRNDLRQSLKVIKEVEGSLKDQKESWVIFAEGTRRHDHQKLTGEFHSGSFKAPMKAMVPIVPVAIYGTHRVLGKAPLYKKYPVTISFLPPIYPKDYENKTTEEVGLMVQESIQRELTFYNRPKDHEKMTKYNPKKYRFNQIIKGS